jgi:regulator of replication initiation timing
MKEQLGREVDENRRLRQQVAGLMDENAGLRREMARREGRP